MSTMPYHAVRPVLPSTLRCAVSGTPSMRRTRLICRSGATAKSSQPPSPTVTTSPFAKRSERESSTTPIAPPRMTAPISTGGRYWSWSLIQIRLVGSSDR